MRLEQLEYLLGVKYTQSMNLASEKFHVSQPAISHALRELEGELENKLLYKTNKGSFLTKQGEIVADHAEQIFALLHEMRLQLAGEMADQEQAALNIAFSHSAEQLYLSQLLSYWYQNHSEIPLKVKTVDVSEAISEVAADQVDMACVTMDKKGQKLLPDEVLFYSVQTFYPYVICNTASALADKSVISVKDLADYRLTTKISQDDAENFGYHFLVKYKMQDNLIASSMADPAFIKEMVSKNIAVGVFFHIQEMSTGSLKFDEYGMHVPIKEKEQFQSGYLVHKKQDREHILPLIEALSEVCQLRIDSYAV